MKVHIISKVTILALLFAFVGCENQEETYSKWAGNGKKRYVGKCESFSVQAGWERFVFNWTISPDQTIKNVRISWSSNDGEDSVVVPAGDGTYTTPATFKNLSYNFECRAMDDEGNVSLPLVQYGRPFSHTHNAVTSFTKTVSKWFFVGTDVVLFLDPMMTNVTGSTLSYTQGGVAKTVDLLGDAAIENGTFLRLSGVDAGTPLVINRSAELEGCIDPVVFEPFTIDRSYVLMNFDFQQQVMNRYNLRKITPEFIASQQTLELDYTLTSLEDILYFPALREVILGGNRFMVGTATNTKFSTLTDLDKSIYALEAMHDIVGLDVSIYNNHFGLNANLPFATAKSGNPALPTLGYLPMTGWTITHANPTYGGVPTNLLDNNPNTHFIAAQVDATAIRTHEITIDMKSIQEIKGFRVTQPRQADMFSIVETMFPDIIRIDVSPDGFQWLPAFHETLQRIGNNREESTVLYMPETLEARYVKITLSDKLFLQFGSPFYTTALGDFMVF